VGAQVGAPRLLDLMEELRIWRAFWTMTDEQRQLWTDLGLDGPLVVSEGQTREQAENLRIDSFRFACAFEGVPVPDPLAGQKSD
jgi:hypothetical protein